jgi:hypothetical protein
LRATSRRTLKPQLSVPGSKRKVEKGIAISAVQPSGVMRAPAVQTPSQSLFRLRPSSEDRASRIAPAGLTSRKYELR